MSHPPIEAYEALDSTNAEARRRAEAGHYGPVWITAGVQTAGRGRRGRAWVSDPGNLAATLLMALSRSPAEAAQISFVAALAAAELADTCLGQGAGRLKWPNDLMVHGRKAAGILVESGPQPDGLWLAVGIGVNLSSAPESVERPAAAFSEFAAHVPGPRDALEVLANAFQKWVEIWLAQGFAPIAEAWTLRAFGLGEPCLVRLPSSTHRGIAEGLEADGALRLRQDDGSILRVTAGDVFFGGDDASGH